MNAADLQLFCSADKYLAIYKPWSRGEWTYATNGNIIVRVPRLADVEENAQAPDAEKLLTSTPAPTDWMRVPRAKMPADVDCNFCWGKKRDPGDRRYKCSQCGGTGKQRAHIGVAFAGTFFDQGYLALIQGWDISPNGQEAAWIRRGAAIGLLMPRQR